VSASTAEVWLTGPAVQDLQRLNGAPSCGALKKMLLLESDPLTVEVAELWAVGARSDGDVYAEMDARVATLGDTPVRRSLAAIIDELGKRAKGLRATPPPEPPSAPESWLVDRLVHSAGLAREDVRAMTSEQAVDAWTEHVSRRR